MNAHRHTHTHTHTHTHAHVGLQADHSSLVQPHDAQLLCSLILVLLRCALYAESDLACGGNGEDPDTPTNSDVEDRDEEPVAPLASTSEDLGSDLEASTGRVQYCGLRENIM